jgi:hypothetical protein
MVNMIDNEQLADVGREIADAILDEAEVPQVVLARMIADDPIVDVIK